MEEALNGLLQAEAENLCEAGRYERTEARKAYRSGSYERIEEWRSRPLREDYPYLFVDGIWFKQSWEVMLRRSVSWWPSA